MFFLTRSAVCIGTVAFLALKPEVPVAPAAGLTAARLLAMCADAPQCAAVTGAVVGSLRAAPAVPGRSRGPDLQRPGPWAAVAGVTDAPATVDRVPVAPRRCAGRGHGAPRCAA